MADSRSFTVLLWKNGAVSADSTSGGELNSSNGRPAQGPIVQKFPNGPFGGAGFDRERTPKPPSGGRPSFSTSGVPVSSVRPLTFVGAPALALNGLLSSRGKPGESELNDIAVV